MKGTETGKDKVKKICDLLRQETLEPAKREAEEILEAATDQAERILAEAHAAADRLHQEARLEIQRQQNVFEASLAQACKQAISALKQSIEEKLFDHQLSKLVTQHMQSPSVLANLINAVMQGIKKEGIEANLSAIISAAVSPREVNQLLAKEILELLKEKSVLVGPLSGGIEVKLHRDHLTLELTDTAMKELIAHYIRKDFREMIFKPS